MLAVHEIGHALGLEHDNNGESIMFPSYEGMPRIRELPEHDRRTIQKLYETEDHKESKSKFNCFYRVLPFKIKLYLAANKFLFSRNSNQKTVRKFF